MEEDEDWLNDWKMWCVTAGLCCVDDVDIVEAAVGLEDGNRCGLAAGTAVVIG